MKRKAQSSIFFVWTAAIVVCLFAVLITLLLSSCGSGEQIPVTTPPPAVAESAQPGESEDPGQSANPDGESGETPAPGESTAPVQQSTVLGETADAGQAYIDRLTFVGDSTTYGLWYYSGQDPQYPLLTGGRSSNQVWTPKSGTLTLSNYATATVEYPHPESGVEITIQEAARQAQPEYLVITLGVNGVSFMDEASFKSCYTDLIKKVLEVSPNTKIICNSIYPVEADYPYQADINNTNITAANGWIQQVAAETGTRYADSCSVLKDANGFLREEYGNGDGIHLNAAGFNAVLGYLRTHAYL